MDKIEDGFRRAEEIMSRLTAETEALGTKTNRRQEELENVPRRHGAVNVRVFRRITDRTAEDMETYASRVEAQLPELSHVYHVTFGAISQAATLILDFEPENSSDLARTADEALELKGVIAGVIGSVTGFRDTIAGLPRITTKFNKAKRHAVRAIDAMIGEFEKLRALASDVETAVRETIERIEDKNKAL